MIGKFNNSVVLRTNIDPSVTFTDALATTRDVDLAGLENADVPIDSVLAHIGVTTLPVQTTMSFQNLGWSGLELPGLAITPVDFDARIVKYELHFEFQDTHGNQDARVEAGEEALVGTLMYSTDLFERTTAECLLERVGRVLEAVAANPNTTVASAVDSACQGVTREG